MRLARFFIFAILVICATPLALLLLAGLLGLLGLPLCQTACNGLPDFIQALLQDAAASNPQSLGLSAVLSQALGESLGLALGALMLALLLGTGLAWLTSQYEFRGRRAFEVLLITPLALPAYVAAYAWVEFTAYSAPLASTVRGWGWLERLPDIRNSAGAATILGLSLMPYIYMLARLAFGQQASRLSEIAASLGVSKQQAFWRIYLPLAWPALAAGASLVVMESLADYGVASYMGINTVTVTVYKTWFAGEQKLTAIALVLCLVISCAALLRLEQRWRGQAAKYQSKVTAQAWTRQRLHGGASLLALGCCTAVLAMGFVIPVSSLLWLWLREGMPVNAARLWPAIGHSVQLATLGALCVLLIASAALLLQRMQPPPMASASNPQRSRFRLLFCLRFRFQSLGFRLSHALATLMRINQLGYAIPGVAIALAILWPVAALDKAVAQLFDTDLLITGSIAGVVLAYVIRFYAVGHNSVEQGLQRITPHMQDAAASLGASPTHIVRRVYLPLLAPTLGTAWVLVWIDCLKELPATLMLRPFNSDTLPVLVFQFISDERPAQAALPSLLLVLVGLVPVFIIAKKMSVAQSTHKT